MAKRFTLALDLVDDPVLIAEYDEYHRAVWPEILESIRSAGIRDMEIYRLGNRLIMIIDAEDHFSFEVKAAMDASNAKVQEWEQMMWKYQQALPMAKAGEKWLQMELVFKLSSQI